MSSITVGPWTTDGQVVFPEGDSANIVAAVRTPKGGMRELFANAYLMAAAPELLEACERMFNSLAAYLDYARDSLKEQCYAPRESLELGRAALAKTKGE